MSGILSGIQSAFSSQSAAAGLGAQPIAASNQVAQGYIVTLSGQDENGTKIGYNQSGMIQAFLPEKFDIGTYSHWQPLSPSSDISGFLSQMGISFGLNRGASDLLGAASKGTSFAEKNAGVISGFTAQFQALSQRFWVSTDPITFALNLQLNATKDAKAEVTGVVESLLSLTLPSANQLGGSNGPIGFRAPGPSLLSSSMGGSSYKIGLAIGGNWLFPSVLIEQVQASFDVLPTSTGDYISADVHLVISTNEIYTKTDLSNAFSNSSSTSSATQPGSITKFVSGAISSGVSDIKSLGNQISSVF